MTDYEESIGARVRQYYGDPGQLEAAYREACERNAGEAFAAAIAECLALNPDDRALQAWQHRLGLPAPPAPPGLAGGDQSGWGRALKLAAASGLLYVVLVGERPPIPFPEVATEWFRLGWSPVAALALIGWLGWGRPEDRSRGVYLSAALATLGVGVVAGALAWGAEDTASVLAGFHLPLLTWAAVGATVVRAGASREAQIYAFALRSMEVLAVAAIFLGAAGLTTGLTAGLLAVFEISLPEVAVQRAIAFAIGAIPVLALATSYDARRLPQEQSSTGVARLLRIVTWLLLPVALGVLAVYVLWLIPVYFWRAFEDREVLIVYNVTLIALVVFMTAAAAPAATGGLSRRRLAWLRPALLSLMSLTLMMNLYALAANATRIVQFGITTNRYVVLGWNAVTLAMIAYMLMQTWRAAPADSATALRAAIGRALVAPVVWSLAVLLTSPLVG